MNNTYSLNDASFIQQLTQQHQINPVEVKQHLTSWKNEPDLSQLKYDLEQAKSSQYAYIADLARWEKLYDAPKFGSDKHKGSRVNPKLVRKQAEWRCPALSEPFLSTSNLFDVSPLTHEDVARATQNALILNNQFNTQLNKVKLVDKIIRSVVKNGTAIVRMGWHTEEKTVTEEIDVFTYTPVPMEMQEQVSQEYQQYVMLKKTEPNSYDQLAEHIKAGVEMSLQKGTLYSAEPSGKTKQQKTKVVVNKPTALVCDLRNVYIDPTCHGDMDNAQFVIHSFESSLSDLKKAGYYKNLDAINLAELNSSLDHSNPSQYDFKFADKARQKLIVYEYWGYWDIDGSGQTKAFVASWVGNTLIRMEENPFPDKKIPFVVFNYLPEDDSVYGIPDAELLEDNQAILGAVTRGMIDLLGKSANSQTGYSKNFLDATNKRRFELGKDYEYNPNFDPRIHVYQHKYPEIPNSALNMVQMMNNEAEAISGVKAFSGTGISGANLGDVAVGIRGVLDAVSKREMSILRRISDGFIAMGRKIMSMNGEFLSEEEVIRITNKEFIKVRRDDLLGNFDLKLTISTAEADDSKAKELAFMLQTMGNTMGQEISQLILSEIATLRKMPELAHKIINYKPQPDPMQQQLQELEMQKLQAEIALLQAEAQESMAKSQVQQAKVGTEQAKAESLQGDVTNKALDFLERDSGVKHQHDLEKQQLANDGVYQQQLARNQAEYDKSMTKAEVDLLKESMRNQQTNQINLSN